MSKKLFFLDHSEKEFIKILIIPIVYQLRFQFTMMRLEEGGDALVIVVHASFVYKVFEKNLFVRIRSINDL